MMAAAACHFSRQCSEMWPALDKLALEIETYITASP
jgi:hypothetical protein